MLDSSYCMEQYVVGSRQGKQHNEEWLLLLYVFCCCCCKGAIRVFRVVFCENLKIKKNKVDTCKAKKQSKAKIDVLRKVGFKVWLLTLSCDVMTSCLGLKARALN